MAVVGSASSGRESDEAAWQRCRWAAPVLLGLVIAPVDGAQSQALTPDPGAWRPLAYSDLQRPTPRSATYTDIWKDQIDANNEAYRVRGDRRFVDGNAPAIAAHFVIWSERRSVVLTVLNTALGCAPKLRESKVRAVVKLCPMRIAIYNGIRVETLDAGRGCYLEPEPGANIDPSASAAYGAYDVGSKRLKLGMVVNHQVVDGCSFNIPLARP
ncbi:hypothetical protein [Bosea spartocytisi]|uniref:hypothetical protein n=1 Tax=Bosea spartocytisi TaxID=2773451 RepID=UPI0021AAF72D|nr:hypothetical protein [Bosea spartocytisi]